MVENTSGSQPWASRSWCLFIWCPRSLAWERTVKVWRKICKLTGAFFWDKCVNFSSTSQSCTHILPAPIPDRMKRVIIGVIEGPENSCSAWRAGIGRCIPLVKRAAPQVKLERILYTLSQTEDRSQLGPGVGACGSLLPRAHGCPLPCEGWRWASCHCLSKTTIPPSSMNFWASSFCLLAKLSVLSVVSYSNKIGRSLKLGL